MAGAASETIGTSLGDMLKQQGFRLEETERGVWAGRRAEPCHSIFGSQSVFYALTCILDDAHSMLRVWDAVLVRRRGLVLFGKNPMAQAAASETRGELELLANRAGWNLQYGSNGAESAPRICRS